MPTCLSCSHRQIYSTEQLFFSLFVFFLDKINLSTSTSAVINEEILNYWKIWTIYRWKIYLARYFLEQCNSSSNNSIRYTVTLHSTYIDSSSIDNKAMHSVHLFYTYTLENSRSNTVQKPVLNRFWFATRIAVMRLLKISGLHYVRIGIFVFSFESNCKDAYRTRIQFITDSVCLHDSLRWYKVFHLVNFNNYVS